MGDDVLNKQRPRLASFPREGDGMGEPRPTVTLETHQPLLNANTC